MGKGISVANALSKGHEENDLGFLVVIVGGPKTMTKRNLFHFFESLGHGLYYKADSLN